MHRLGGNLLHVGGTPPSIAKCGQVLSSTSPLPVLQAKFRTLLYKVLGQLMRQPSSRLNHIKFYFEQIKSNFISSGSTEHTINNMNLPVSRNTDSHAMGLTQSGQTLLSSDCGDHIKAGNFLQPPPSPRRGAFLHPRAPPWCTFPIIHMHHFLKIEYF